MPTRRRYPLKAKDAKLILDQAIEKLKVDFAKESIVEVVESNVGDIYIIDGKPILFKSVNRILPTLLFSEFITKAPKVVVDMGAVPFVCKGATIMAPGIVRIEGNFTIGDMVLVVDVKHGKALAIGAALMNSDTVRYTKKGPIVKTIHYVSDKIWNYIKTFSE